MSSLDYITLPIEVDADAVFQTAVDYLRLQWPDWQPADGNLDSWLMRAWAAEAAELRELASEVPTAIFRYLGANLVDVPPVDAAPAAVNTTWTMRDNAGYTILAGTQVGIRSAGDELIAFEVVGDVIVPPGSTVTSVGAVQLIAVTPGADGSGLGGVGAPVELIDPLDFVTAVVMTSATSGGADAEDDDVYLSRLRAELTLLSPRPILPADFAILARTIPGVFRSVALDLYNPLHNWLSANAASIETDATGWVNDTNVAVTRVVTDAADGVASLAMTSAAAGSMVARSAQAIAVLAGETWTALASAKAGSVVRSVKVSIRWYSDAGGTVLISTSDGAAANDATTGYTAYSVTAQAPATAVSARVIITVAATAGAGEVHRADKMSLRRGSTTDWVAGGTTEFNNERMITVVSIDANGNAVSAPVKGQVQALLDGKREATFVVNVMDPTYTAIDVTFTFKTVTGYSLVEVEADAEAAVAAYLSASNWGRDPFAPNPATDTTWNNVPVVRYLELAQVINSVLGVDYITALTLRYGANALAAADVNLPGAVPLPTPGVIAGTAT